MSAIVVGRRMAMTGSAVSLRRLVCRLVVVAVVVLALPTSAGASVIPFTASFQTAVNTSDFSQFNAGAQTGGPGASISISGAAYDGDFRSATASYAGGGANNYARAVEDVNWGDGDDVWYGEAVYLPVGFKAAMQGEVSLMRWDDYPSVASGADSCGTLGGLVIRDSDKQARLVQDSYSCHNQKTLVGPFDIPEGQWVWFDVHQHFAQSDGQALTQVYMNGSLIGSSTLANKGAYPIERLRYGLVAITAGAQTNPLNLWFDRAYIGTSQLGPYAPPTIAITSPNAGTTVSQPITITTNTSNITPAKVRFFADGQWIGFTMSSPWSLTWDPYGWTSVGPGDHQLTAQVFDAAGKSVVSAPVAIHVP